MYARNFEHFCDKDHDSLSNISIMFTDKPDPSNPLKHRNYWKQTLSIFVPTGVNKEYV